jgi:hypothetical protein
MTLVAASTPILLAALGELVVEKAGVLNLGVEGMMLCGAVAGFAVAFSTGSTALGLVAAAGRRRDGDDLRRADAEPDRQPGRDGPGADDLRHRRLLADRRRLRRQARSRGSGRSFPRRCRAIPAAAVFGHDIVVYLSLALVLRRRPVPAPDAGRA